MRGCGDEGQCAALNSHGGQDISERRLGGRYIKHFTGAPMLRPQALAVSETSVLLSILILTRALSSGHKEGP